MNNNNNTGVMAQLRQLWAMTGIFTKCIIFTLIAVFAVQYALYKGDFNTVGSVFGSCNAPVVHAGQIWRLVTAEFTHGGYAHIIFNIFALLSFGINVEQHYGTLFYASLHIWVMIISQTMDIF